jgi:hypothetical protein
MEMLLKTAASAKFCGGHFNEWDQRLAPGLGFTFAPGEPDGGLVAILPAPLPTEAGNPLVTAFLGLPLDSFRVSLAMTASRA